MRYVEIEQVGSPIRRRADQRRTLVGLKLNKVGRVAWLPGTPATRGMIHKVRHLVKITHDPAAPRVAAGAPAPDEAADIQLLRDLICDANSIVLERYDKAALNRGKTPDFKLIIDGELVGYCEVKSLFDPGILQDPPEGVMAVRKDLPFYRKLGQNVRGAVEQLNAENPDHDKPNVIVFVSHTPEIERKDLIATIAGLPVSDGERLFMLGRKMQGQVCEAARKVDLIIWIDATTSTCQHLTVADAKHRATALKLFGLPE
ncbi:ribosomal protein L30 [Bradyrhizobium sp. USDA 4448]